jgi:hypothetical protein
MSYLHANNNNLLWEKILHHYHNENQIVSNEFYLSSSKNPSAEEELNATKELLLGPNGFETACAFPRRYEYIKSNFSEVPDFNLNSCEELNQYLASFPKDKLSIVFTSEYTNNPSSAFGHIMLLFSNNNTSLEVGDVVHFAAKTSTEDGFFKYSYKGFSGGYHGYFIREPFFEKIYEYNTLEQRYMYIYTLDFSKEEIRSILYHLFELRKATFKYYFLDGNCASQTTDLLNVLNTNNNVNKGIYYLPIQTVTDLENRIVEKKRFIPLINKLNLLLKNMTLSEKKLFNKIIESQEPINDNAPDVVKEAMVIYTTFNFRRIHNIHKNYENVMNQTYNKKEIVDKTPDPLLKSKPSNLGMGYFSNKKDTYLNINYRPLFIDLFDIQNNDLQESQIDTFTFDLLLKENHIKLNKFDLINIKSLPLQTSYYKPLSWALYSGFNRDNNKEDLNYTNEFGLGRTLELNDFLRASFLLNTGIDNLNYFIKPNLLLNFYTSVNTKVGISSSYKRYDGEYFYQNELYTSYKYRSYLFSFKYSNDNSKNTDKYFISAKYNF